jgi:hypothetical protein
MKKIFIVLVCFVALIGCNPNANFRDVYVEFELLDNPDNATMMTCIFMLSQITVDNGSVVPVGTMWVSDAISVYKGYNTQFTCDISTPNIGSSSLCEYQVKFYVDGNLEETRTQIGSSGDIIFRVP